MRLRAISTTPATTEVDVLAVPIYRDESGLDGDLADLDQASGGAIRAAIAWGEFNPVEHASALVDAGTLPAGRLLLLNAGARGRGAVARSPAGGGRDAATERARRAEPRPLAPRRRRPT